MSHTPLLLLQLVVILATARACGWLLRHVGQPAVIGEMAAGIVLGPIVFGAAFPGFHAALFAQDSLPALSSLSTLGLVLFMFIVGAELRAPDGVRAQLKAAGAVGVLGVLAPMALGIGISPWLHPTLAPAGVGFWPFALFMATAMSITAFPVMARILKDRGMTQTRLGRLALSSAAIADVFAWIMLAFVVALIGSDEGYAGVAMTTLGLLVLCVLVFGALKPLYAHLLRRHAPEGRPSLMLLAAMLVGALACAALTEWLGLHAVFGAFLFGACLPRDDRLLRYLSERVEYLAIVLLMPIFFALAGLNTTADAFAGAGLGALLLILGAAVLGKLAGGALGARVAGYGWRDSLATGSLMNARGLMELIVMKVGLDAGLIGPELFTMLLVMAILTTVMTGPLLILFAGRVVDPLRAQA
ncbi:Kef-type K+ transport system membrane component KefB [Luteimonas cucumeris]|uniref:Kef-type K+ transport system membrane component KefB n=1 Tax=Luteimonas cucumeris TaxID=985012 RepID=A0A562KX94_9GAMM|nr:cation:proton antiporter [Luteimonas cucumeris]TWH99967.1 Kef-type K+ transport system membrane component KefB [Luteimonas cucumeris]